MIGHHFFTCCYKITSNNWTMATKANFNYLYRDISSTFTCMILHVRGQVLSYGFLEASVYTVQIIIITIKTGIMIHMQKKNLFPQTRLCARLHKVVVFSWYTLLSYLSSFQNLSWIPFRFLYSHFLLRAGKTIRRLPSLWLDNWLKKASLLGPLIA